MCFRRWNAASIIWNAFGAMPGWLKYRLTSKFNKTFVDISDLSGYNNHYIKTKQIVIDGDGEQ
ncbi:hypothetical protein JCM39194_13340 [Desulfotomaculum varum]